MLPFTAVILTGGTASRMGGADKASLLYAGESLLERALSAVEAAEETVVVGPEQPTSRPVRFVREDPPLGGPAAGLLAGRDSLGTAVELLVVVAVDMPLVRADTLDRLLSAVGEHDGAFLVDRAGRRQLAGVVRLQALDEARPGRGRETGLPLHRLLASLDLADVPPADQEERDVDTWEDYADLPS